MSRYLTEKFRVVMGVGFRGFARFLEGFWKKWLFACGVFVVSCGGMRGKCGRETVIARNPKKGTGILTLFLIGGFGGHPQGLAVAPTRGRQGFWKGFPMETSYLLIAFLMMIALPFLISRLGSAGRDDVLPSLEAKNSKWR
jgi:hypothetical protein